VRSWGGERVIEAAADGEISLTVVSQHETNEIVEQIADAFVERPEAAFWWDSLPSISASLHYGRARDPFSAAVGIIEQLAGGPRSDVIMLIGIDERHDEAGHDVDGIRGTVEMLMKALAECPGFEFIITTEDTAWAIFDTHHDIIVVSGDPPGLSRLEAIKHQLTVG
jgi:hypothetical protein